MIPLTPDYAAEILYLDLYRLQTETLLRHAILAEEVGAKEVAQEYLAEVKRRDETERKAA